MTDETSIEQQRESGRGPTVVPTLFSRTEDVRLNKDLAALSYVSVLSVVLYILRRDSPFVRFHSKQAMVLFVVSLAVWFIPWIGRFLELIVLAGMVLGFLAAAQGEWKNVPFVGPLSRGEASLRDTWRQMAQTIAALARGIRGGVRKDRMGKAERRQYAPPDPPRDSSPPSV